MGLQVDNPCAVLDQENSKKFLQGNEKDKYAFFMKATDLDRVLTVSAKKIKQIALKVQFGTRWTLSHTGQKAVYCLLSTVCVDQDPTNSYQVPWYAFAVMVSYVDIAAFAVEDETVDQSTRSRSRCCRL